MPLIDKSEIKLNMAQTGPTHTGTDTPIGKCPSTVLSPLQLLISEALLICL